MIDAFDSISALELQIILMRFLVGKSKLTLGSDVKNAVYDDYDAMNCISDELS